MANKTFKSCAVCGAQWATREDFLSDDEIRLVGYQAHFEELETGLLYFDHSCKNTLAVQAEDFKDMYDGPVFTKCMRGTSECPEYCQHKDDLSYCANACECSWIRKVLKVISERYNKKINQLPDRSLL